MLLNGFFTIMQLRTIQAVGLTAPISAFPSYVCSI